MIEMNIPRDVSKFEAKTVGMFTTRQIVCYIPGGIIAAVTGYVGYRYIGDLAIMLAVILALPLFLVGSWKPYGIPLERFAKTAIVSMFIAPTNRKYISENTMEANFPCRTQSGSITHKRAQGYRSPKEENAKLL